MDWTKQAETMMQTWTEAQKKMWEGWFDLAKTTTDSGPTPLPAFTDMFKPWQQMMQGANMWTSTADPAARNVARQLIAGQEAMYNFLQVVTRAWQAMAPKIEAGEDWQTVLNEYSNQWVQTMIGGPAGMMSAGQDINELGKFYMQEWHKLTQPWMQLMQESPGHFGKIAMGGSTELAELSKMHWDVYERTFGRLTEVPGMGYNRELNAKIANAFDGWVDLQKANAKFQQVMGRTFSKAFEKFMKDMVTMSEKGEKIDSVRDLMNMWMETIDQSFTYMYVSEDYLEVQNELAASVMKYKMKQQQVIEVIQGMFDMPTRSELDDAYRTMYELRKEVRALKKSLKEENTSSSASKSSSRSKSTSKRKSSKEEEAAEAAAAG